MVMLWNSKQRAWLAMPDAPHEYTGIVTDARIFLKVEQAEDCASEFDVVVNVANPVPLKHLVTRISVEGRRA